MPELWVVNASPIITLAKINRLSLLDSLAEIILPDAVGTELLAGPVGDPARIAVAAGWARRTPPVQIPPEVMEWGLGAGESSVLAVSLEKMPATAVLDDASARTAARALGVPVIGTLGIVIRAKVQGLIPAAAPLVNELQRAGLFLDPAMVRAVLAQFGELPVSL